MQRLHSRLILSFVLLALIAGGNPVRAHHEGIPGGDRSIEKLDSLALKNLIWDGVAPVEGQAWAEAADLAGSYTLLNLPLSPARYSPPRDDSFQGSKLQILSARSHPPTMI